MIKILLYWGTIVYLLVAAHEAASSTFPKKRELSASEVGTACREIFFRDYRGEEKDKNAALFAKCEGFRVEDVATGNPPAATTAVTTDSTSPTSSFVATVKKFFTPTPNHPKEEVFYVTSAPIVFCKMVAGDGVRLKASPYATVPKSTIIAQTKKDGSCFDWAKGRGLELVEGLSRVEEISEDVFSVGSFDLPTCFIKSGESARLASSPEKTLDKETPIASSKEGAGGKFYPRGERSCKDWAEAVMKEIVESPKFSN